MKKKSVYWALVLIMIMTVLLCSCSTDGYIEEDETEETTEALVTSEELYTKTYLTPSDFEGVDVNEFISRFQLRSSDCNDSFIKNCYREYTKEPEVSYLDDYKYLIESPLKSMDEGMEDQIKTIYVETVRRFGEWGVEDVLVIDFEKKQSWDDNGQIREIREGDAEKTAKLLKESGIGKMMVKTKGINLHGERYEIIIESKDGRIAHYKGTNHYPANIEKLVDGLEEIFLKETDS